jgi:hypothetical protein
MVSGAVFDIAAAGGSLRLGSEDEAGSASRCAEGPVEVKDGRSG